MTSATLKAGDVVADVYEIRALLGAGGMGEVYEAQDRALNRRVAIKTVRPTVPSEHLLREGRALAAIHHPGIVTVHTMGQHKGAPFLVLERVHGLSLDRVLKERRSRGEPFPPTEALELLIAIADALAAVHRAGLSHRDVKPSNVMIAPGGRIVLMDFGLVLPNADRAGHRSVVGSLDYMPPEALTGDVAEGAGHLIDIYALGVLGYELLVGTLPAAGANELDVVLAKTRLPSMSTVRPDVSEALGLAIAQLASPDPNERPQSAEAAMWQLRAIRAQLGSSGPPLRRFTALVVVDDNDMLRALSLVVRAAVPDAVIETVREGRKAVRFVRRRVPDLLLLDLDLPDINGIEVCMLLRGMQLGDACAIVSVSGRATPADVDLLAQLGVKSLEKGPQLMKDLVALIGRMRTKARSTSGAPSRRLTSG